MKKRCYLNINDITDMDNLDELIAISYQVFYADKPSPIKGVCTYCCLGEDSVLMIDKLPLHQLSREVIYDYLDAAQCDEYWLSDEIRYFVPRIFELLYKGEHIRHSTELTFDKFYVQLDVWSDKQLAVLVRFCELYFKDILTKYDDEFHWIEIFEILLMFYKAGLKELDRFLAILLKSLNNDVALINLCGDIYWGLYDGYDNAFSDDVFNQMIDTWIKDKYVKGIISHKILALTQKKIYQHIDDEKRYWLDVAFDKMTA